MGRQNVTISLPVSVLKKAKHLAVEEGSSLSGLLASFVERLVDEAAEKDRAARRIKRRVGEGLDLGTCGSITWTRDDVHER
ncbi:MAG: CopG family transcriptional regulator [Proteobacteria bacterium]|jgi:hypothetical protein|nr:CopG family transcriptional regulator [Pseudomonadota bacterium]